MRIGEGERKRRSEQDGASEARLANMISKCAAAHPCIELFHSENRVHPGTLFICQFFWLHTDREAESCDYCMKCNIVFDGGSAEKGRN